LRTLKKTHTQLEKNLTIEITHLQISGGRERRVAAAAGLILSTSHTFRDWQDSLIVFDLCADDHAHFAVGFGLAARAGWSSPTLSIAATEALALAAVFSIVSSIAVAVLLRFSIKKVGVEERRYFD
jgi:hypothetical protein